MNSSAKRYNIKRPALLGALTAAALLVFMLESLLPPLFFPGAKLGLSNIFTLLCLIVLSPAEALILLLVRVSLGSIFSGNPFAAVYGISAGVAGLLAGALLITAIPKISVVAVSVACAVVHNLVQNAVFCLVSGSTAAFVYLPYLALIGALSGAVTGACVYFLIHKIPLSVYEKAVAVKANTGKGGSLEYQKR